MKTNEVVLSLSGSEFALLNAVCFALAVWPFETKSAKALRNSVDTAAAGTLHDTVSSQWTQSLKEAGLWENWTAEGLKRRSGIAGSLRLSQSELDLCKLAARACVSEFQSNWEEFTVATPGNLNEYGLRLSDLLSLTHRLEKM